MATLHLRLLNILSEFFKHLSSTFAINKQYLDIKDV
jgi:hypothetical protein